MLLYRFHLLAPFEILLAVVRQGILLVLITLKITIHSYDDSHACGHPNS